MDLVLTGRPVDAAEAERIGLVNRVVPAGEELAAARELAARLAAFPQVCLRHDRLSVREQGGTTEVEARAGTALSRTDQGAGCPSARRNFLPVDSL